MEAVNTHVQQAAAARRYFWPSGTEPLLSGPAKYLDPLCSCLPVHFQVSGWCRLSKLRGEREREKTIEVLPTEHIDSMQPCKKICQWSMDCPNPTQNDQHVKIQTNGARISFCKGKIHKATQIGQKNLETPKYPKPWPKMWQLSLMQGSNHSSHQETQAPHVALVRPSFGSCLNRSDTSKVLSWIK